MGDVSSAIGPPPFHRRHDRRRPMTRGRAGGGHCARTVVGYSRAAVTTTLCLERFR